MHDCHEAMVKIKMAFSTGNAQKEVVVDLEPLKRPSEANLNVANFGEAAEPYLILDPQPFAIPFDLDDLQNQPPEEWAVAEDHEDSQNVNSEGRNAMLNDAELTMDTDLTMLNQEPEEEWTAFDPDDDGDRHVFEDSKSKISDVELARGAEGSVSTNDSVRRPSLLDEMKQKPTTPGMSDGEFPMDGDISNIPFDDDDEEASREDQAPSDSSIRLDLSRSKDDLTDMGLPVSPEEEKPKKKRKSTVDRRKRKRRKVLIDNDNKDLSNEHIRAMLKDCSDIVLDNKIHPADWIEQDAETRTDASKDLRTALPYDVLIARPRLGDDGCLNPELLALWTTNASEVRGKPKSYRLRGRAGEEQRARTIIEDAAKAEDVEIRRRDQESDSGSEKDSMDGEFAVADDIPQDASDLLEAPPAFDDEDEDVPQLRMSDSGMNLDTTPTSPGEVFELGLVNDFEDDIEHDPRQEAGSELASSASKWHKHTVKVLSMLQRNLANPSEDKVDVPSHLSYSQLSNDCSRRTAASVFFELLQLKTWDFIELDQDESYGDIKVSL